MDDVTLSACVTFSRHYSSDSPRPLSSPGPLEDTHNDGRDDNNNDDYDEVKALLRPKIFDEANAKVLPRRRTRGGQLRLSTSLATQAAPARSRRRTHATECERAHLPPPPSPCLLPSPMHGGGGVRGLGRGGGGRRQGRGARRRRSPARRRRPRAEECRAPRGGRSQAERWGRERGIKHYVATPCSAVARVVQGHHLPPERRAVVELWLQVSVPVCIRVVARRGALSGPVGPHIT